MADVVVPAEEPPTSFLFSMLLKSDDGASALPQPAVYMRPDGTLEFTDAPSVGARRVAYEI